MNTKSNEKIKGTDVAWDEGLLGASEEHAAVANANEPQIDEALDLQMISIRLQKSLIEDFKYIAALHGLGYQPLMRQVLTRFADAEKKCLLRQVASQHIEELKEEQERLKAEQNARKSA